MLVWKPSLELGVAEIDAQHKALFEVAGRFSAAVEARESVAVLEELFAFLAEYALDHFAAEERLMREVGYPELAQHIQEHTLFKRQLASLVPQWSSEGASPAVLMALRGFLELWLTEHVTTSDQRIGDYVRNSQLSRVQGGSVSPDSRH
jgi:hemerythrin